MIHAFKHQTLHLNLSKAFRRELKLILYSDRAKISLQKYNLNLILHREIFANFNAEFRTKDRFKTVLY